jgi:hypothetical protein
MDKVRRKSSKASPKKEKKDKKKKKEKKESDKLTESSAEEQITNPLHQSQPASTPTTPHQPPPQPQGAYTGVYARTFPVKSAYAPLAKDAKKEKKWVTKCCKTSKPGLMWMACYVVAFYLFKVCLLSFVLSCLML